MKHTQPNIKIGDLTVDFEGENLGSFISNLINRTVNTAWRLFQNALNPLLNKYVAVIFIEVFSKINDQIAIQDVIQV